MSAAPVLVSAECSGECESSSVWTKPSERCAWRNVPAMRRDDVFYTLVNDRGVRVLVFGREIQTHVRSAAVALLKMYASDPFRGPWHLAQRRQSETAFVRVEVSK